MDVLYVRINVDQASAVRAGRNEYGRTIVPVDAAALTEPQREELLRCPLYNGAGRNPIAYRDPYRMPLTHPCYGLDVPLPVVPDATMASLGLLLDARPGAVARLAAEHAAKREAAIVAALAQPDKEWLSHDGFSTRVPWTPSDVGSISDDPRVQQRLVRMGAAAEENRQKRDAEVAARAAAEQAAKEAAAAERAAWIAAHGSARLKRLAAERIEHDAVYRDERIAHDRPGWMWLDNMTSTDDPRNPPAEAIDLLDEARKTEAGAVLRYFRTWEHRPDDPDAVDGAVQTSRGYLAKSSFMGRDIVTVKRVVIDD